MVIRSAILCALVVSGCVQQELEQPLELPELDEQFFRCEVEPVLVKHCSFEACHGTDERPLRIYAPYRYRLDGRGGAVLTAAERNANYQRALGFVGLDGAPPLLLYKALETNAGGFFHRGSELYGGGDTFAGTDDPGYRAIEAWITGDGQASTDCVPNSELGS